jgi:hypothetical protein
MSETSFWNDTFAKILTVYANFIFTVLWIGFIIILIVNREWLDELWTWVGALPLVPRIIVWVLILPIMVGLWIWESSWPTLGRIAGFAAIVSWTLLAISSMFRNFR